MHHLIERLVSASAEHPVTTGLVATGGGFTLSLVAILQSAQEIVGTLIALVTSLSGLAMALYGLKTAMRKKD